MTGRAAAVLLRIDAIILVLFAAGHTFGFLGFVPPTVEARGVLESMKGVAFSAGGRQSTYFDFYVGFGLSISAYLLFIAALSWQLGGMARVGQPAFRRIAAALALLEAANLVIAIVLFSAGPAVFSAVVLVLTVAAVVQRSEVDQVAARPANGVE